MQPNGVLAIPHLQGATELIHCADNRPTATFASEFRVIFDYDLAHFADLVGIGYLGTFHDPLCYVVSVAMPSGLLLISC